MCMSYGMYVCMHARVTHSCMHIRRCAWVCARMDVCMASEHFSARGVSKCSVCCLSGWYPSICYLGGGTCLPACLPAIYAHAFFVRINKGQQCLKKIPARAPGHMPLKKNFLSPQQMTAIKSVSLMSSGNATAVGGC